MGLRLSTKSLQAQFRKIALSLRYYTYVTWQRLVFRLLWKIAPRRAVDRATKLFLTPPRDTAFSIAEFESMEEASLLSVPSPTGRLIVWRWGRAKKPAVVLVHGWGGRGTQLRKFIDPIVQRGFSVVAFDAPGHGMTGEGESSVPHMLHGLTAVLDHLESVHAVIGHSVGGAVTAMALAKRPSVTCGVLIAPPASLIDFSRSLATRLRWPEDLRASMQRRIEIRFGYKWTAFEAESSSGSQPLLVIHDSNDREVSLSEGARHASNWPQAQLLTTKGLGHRRILEDSATVLAAADFIAAHQQ